MIKRPNLQLLFAGIALLGLPGPRVAAAQDLPAAAPETAEKIAVLPLEIVGDVPAGRPALETAVSRGLTIAAAPSLPAAEAAVRLRAGNARLPCEDTDCWSAIGKLVDARFLVVGKVERRAAFFEVAFRLIDAPNGRLLASLTNECEADDCSVAEQCRLTVRELARQNLTQLDELRSAPLSSPGPEPAPPPARVETVVRARPADQPVDQWGTRKRWALASLVGGALLGAGGGALVYLHNSCAQRFTTGDPGCVRLRGSTNNELLIGGIAAGAVGVGLVTTGAVLLLTGRGGAGERRSGGPVLSIGPGSLLLSGRF